jgi:hypothetical protein
MIPDLRPYHSDSQRATMDYVRGRSLGIAVIDLIIELTELY